MLTKTRLLPVEEEETVMLPAIFQKKIASGEITVLPTRGTEIREQYSREVANAEMLLQLAIYEFRAKWSFSPDVILLSPLAILDLPISMWDTVQPVVGQDTHTVVCLGVIK